MVYNSKDEFFKASVAMRSAVMVKEFKLTPKEIDFLSELYVMDDKGMDVSNFSLLRERFVGNGFFKNRFELSQYKNKLRAKKWIKGGRNRLMLPPIVSKSNTEYSSKFEVKYR